jgi:hypothetical protein
LYFGKGKFGGEKFTLQRRFFLKNYQLVLKFLPQIFGSETSDRVDNFLNGPLASKKSE